MIFLYNDEKCVSNSKNGKMAKNVLDINFEVFVLTRVSKNSFGMPSIEINKINNGIFLHSLHMCFFNVKMHKHTI